MARQRARPLFYTNSESSIETFLSRRGRQSSWVSYNQTIFVGQVVYSFYFALISSWTQIHVWSSWTSLVLSLWHNPITTRVNNTLSGPQTINETNSIITCLELKTCQNAIISKHIHLITPNTCNWSPPPARHHLTGADLLFHPNDS